MKKLIFSIAAAVFAVSSFAQTSPKTEKTPEEMASKRAEKLKTELSLSDDQKAKVQAALLERITKVKEIKAKYPNDKKAANKEIKPVLLKFRENMKSTLTAEQYTKWEESKKNAKAKRKDKKAAPALDDDDDTE